MKLFYWTEEIAEYPRRFYQVDTEANYCAQVPAHEVGPTMIKAMMDDGFTEISPHTAYKMGMPS